MVDGSSGGVQVASSGMKFEVMSRSGFAGVGGGWC